MKKFGTILACILMMISIYKYVDGDTIETNCNILSDPQFDKYSKSVVQITTESKDSNGDNVTSQSTGFAIENGLIVVTRFALTSQKIYANLVGRKRVLCNIVNMDNYILILRPIDNIECVPFRLQHEVPYQLSVHGIGVDKILHGLVLGNTPSHDVMSDVNCNTIAITFDEKINEAGGPIIDTTTGSVIGILALQSTTDANVGFALPSESIMRLIPN